MIMDPYTSRRVAVVHPFRHVPPQRVTRRRRRQPSPEAVESDWPIHRGYLRITLADVACETQTQRLQQWLQVFSPSTQPQSPEEHFYVNTMNIAIEEKLTSLTDE